MGDGTNLKKLLSKSSAALFMRAAAAGVAFLLNVYVTRTLGPSEAGLFFLGQFFLVILGTVSRFGMDLLLVRFVSVAMDRKDSEGANGVLISASIITLPLSVVMATACYLAAPWIAEDWYHKPEMTPILQAVAASIVPFSIFQMFTSALQGRSQVAMSVTVGTAMFPGLVLILAQMLGGEGVNSAAQLMTIATGAAVLNALIALILWLRRTPLRATFDVVNQRELIRSAIPMFVSTLIVLSNTWIPHLILGAYVESDQIAMLNNAHKTATLVGFFLLAITSAAAPTYASLYSRGDIDGLKTFVAKVNGIVLLTTAPLLLALFIFSEPILAVFGEEFVKAAWLLRVLTIGQVVNAVAGSVTYLLVMSGNERLFRNTIAIAGMVGLALSVTLIPSYGAMGAAVVVTLIGAISNLLAAIQAFLKLGINVLLVDFLFLAKAMRRLRYAKNT